MHWCTNCISTGVKFSRKSLFSIGITSSEHILPHCFLCHCTSEGTVISKYLEHSDNKELEAFRTALSQELSDEHQTLEEIQGDIIEYIDCYFFRAYFYQLKEINKKKNDIYHEESH